MDLAHAQQLGWPTPPRGFPVVPTRYPAQLARDIRVFGIRRVFDSSGDKIAAKIAAEGVSAPLVNWYPGHIAKAVR